MESKPPLDVQIRWLIRRDMAEVLDIEQAIGGPFRWDDETYLIALRQRNCIGMIAEDSKARVVGAMVYELHRAHLHLNRMIVHPALRRRGIATQMLDRLKSKLSQTRRNMISASVPESDLAFLLTLRSAGFLANRYLTPGEFGEDDGIFLTYLLPRDDRPTVPVRRGDCVDE